MRILNNLASPIGALGLVLLAFALSFVALVLDQANIKSLTLVYVFGVLAVVAGLGAIVTLWVAFSGSRSESSWAQLRNLRPYLWFVGGPILFGLLLGTIEWLISRSFYNAASIGAATYALTQLGFEWWATNNKQQQDCFNEQMNERAEAHRNRIGLIHALHGLWDEGDKFTRWEHSQQDLEDWRDRAGKLVEMAWGVEKRRGFLKSNPEYAKWSDDVNEGDSEEQVYLKCLLDRLKDRLHEANRFMPPPDLFPHFDIQVYREWLEKR